ncbi:M23 family metallopeptidase [Rhizobium sp. L1K21]|uniref:M23 family metallopeptidase n=1 Tax=Rhizobium sp. L1K21 TaxID=2954933 RepID=UPI0020935269|nr:M23 family metallopeptidase [Rhizobium sp. L1K21]MCO6188217.1 M23 family metallopeptidase [Rhizobium sp. L1K21]
MGSDRNIVKPLGDTPPILANVRRVPDRREVSFRWLSGTFLTGITSTILMGVALSAAVEGRRQLAIPAEAYASTENSNAANAAVTVKGSRLFPANIASKPSDREILEVSTMVQEGGKEVVRRQPFAHVKMSLAANRPVQEDYPKFNPLALFSDDGSSAQPSGSFSGTIYGSDVETEISLETRDFPPDGRGLNYAPPMSLEEVEEIVRTNGSVLADGNTQVASLFYVDPRRFAAGNDPLDITAGLSAKVIETNVSVSAPELIRPESPEYADDIIPIRREMTVATALAANGYNEAQAADIADYLGPELDDGKLEPGDVLRVGIIQSSESLRVVRASVYRDSDHLVTIALDDKGRFVEADEPPMLDALANAFDEEPQAVAVNRDLPSVYDGVYRAALSYGMGQDLTAQMVRLLANNVDFQARLKPADKLEVLFTVADKDGNVTDDSELLFIYAKFGDTVTRLYRYQNPDDQSIDYFDQDGKSIHQFLLRNPVPNGVFRSGFGMRRHPILGYMRMHTGVDWAAPRGTPIIATGNGTVISAGWDKGGYGNQTLIQHANGYVTSYNHQNAIAKDVVPGAKVRQGQVIGWIGTTGLSTGPHLHYEMIVNGTKVDPLKIRLPDGKTLKGPALVKFEDERKRIDELLGHSEWQQVASN